MCVSYTIYWIGVVLTGTKRIDLLTFCCQPLSFQVGIGTVSHASHFNWTAGSSGVRGEPCKSLVMHVQSQNSAGTESGLRQTKCGTAAHIHFSVFSVPLFFADVAGLEFQTRSHSHKTACYPNKQYAEGLQELLGKAEAGP